MCISILAPLSNAPTDKHKAQKKKMEKELFKISFLVFLLPFSGAYNEQGLKVLKLFALTICV